MSAAKKNETNWNEALIDAVVRSDVGRIHEAVAAGADIDAVCTDGFHRGRTPLIIAADGCLENCLTALLGYGADVNKTDRFGNTALMFAAEGRSNRSLIALIQANVDLDAQNDTGVTALMRAVRADTPANAWVLIDAGADITRKNLKEETVVEWAAEHVKGGVLVTVLSAIKGQGLEKEMSGHIEKGLERLDKFKHSDVHEILDSWLTKYRQTILRREHGNKIKQKQQGLRQYVHKRKP